jgi:hypothetical protein
MMYNAREQEWGEGIEHDHESGCANISKLRFFLYTCMHRKGLECMCGWPHSNLSLGITSLGGP